MAELIRGTLRVTEHIEDLLFMDKYGRQMRVSVSMTDGPTRAAKIASILDGMAASEAKVDSYYVTNGHDPSVDLAAGAAAIAAALANPEMT